METWTYEDVFPTENGEKIQLAMLVYRSVIAFCWRNFWKPFRHSAGGTNLELQYMNNTTFFPLHRSLFLLAAFFVTQPFWHKECPVVTHPYKGASRHAGETVGSVLVMLWLLLPRVQ